MSANGIAGILILILVLCIGGCKGIIYHTTQDTIQVVVTEKERVVSENSSKYLIFTENETFKNTDTIWAWKWNSSDLYGKIKKGGEYKMRVYGFRVGFLSWYRNIVDFEEI